MADINKPKQSKLQSSDEEEKNSEPGANGGSNLTYIVRSNPQSNDEIIAAFETVSEENIVIGKTLSDIISIFCLFLLDCFQVFGIFWVFMVKSPLIVFRVFIATIKPWGCPL